MHIRRILYGVQSVALKSIIFRSGLKPCSDSEKGITDLREIMAYPQKWLHSFAKCEYLPKAEAIETFSGNCSSKKSCCLL